MAKCNLVNIERKHILSYLIFSDICTITELKELN